MQRLQAAFPFFDEKSVGWGELLAELQPRTDANGKTIPALTCDELRTKYISALSKKTGRNVVAYYSGWLKPGKTQNIDINDSDITGFMNALDISNILTGSKS